MVDHVFLPQNEEQRKKSLAAGTTTGVRNPFGWGGIGKYWLVLITKTKMAGT